MRSPRPVALAQGAVLLVAVVLAALPTACVCSDTNSEVLALLKRTHADISAAKAKGDEMDLAVACAEVMIELETDERKKAVEANAEAKKLADEIRTMCAGALEDDIDLDDDEEGKAAPAEGSEAPTGTVAPDSEPATPAAAADEAKSDDRRGGLVGTGTSATGAPDPTATDTATPAAR